MPKGKKFKKGEVKIRKVKLNNKSRKGDYYYIKEAGKRPAYYKIRAGVTIDNYLMAYEGKIKVKKKGVLQYTKETPAERYLKRAVSDKRRIDKLISKGITETTINRVSTIDRRSTHKAYVKMLSPLVKDKELLSIIALEENVKKFKHRIQSSIKLTSLDGNIEINLKTFNKTLMEINNDMRLFRKQDINEEDLQNVLKKGYRMDGIPRGVDITGSRYHIIANKIGGINVKLKFVKAK